MTENNHAAITDQAWPDEALRKAFEFLEQSTEQNTVQQEFMIVPKYEQLAEVPFFFSL